MAIPVKLHARRCEELQGTAAMASPTGGVMLPVPTDVSDPASVKALFATAKGAFGRPDVLFNNAGRNAPAIPMEDLTFEQWSAVVGVNLTGAFLCAQEAIRLMKVQQPQGSALSTTVPFPHTSRDPTPRPTPPPSTLSPGSLAASPLTAAISTSRAARSISATPPPR